MAPQTASNAPTSNVEIARAACNAYVTKDRAALEALLASASSPARRLRLRRSALSSCLEKFGDAEVEQLRDTSAVTRMFDGLMSRWTTRC